MTPPGERRWKLFFAIFPDDAARLQIANAVDALQAQFPQARWVSPQRQHLTLHYLGDSPQRDEAAIARALQLIQGWRCAPFAITLGHLRALGHPRRPELTLAASGVPQGLAEGWSELHRRVLAAGFRDEGERGFLPHLTLAYTPPSPVLPAAPGNVLLRASEYRLILSVTGQAEYETLGRWPLLA